MSIIETIHAWEILDSRGNPTIAARVDAASGATGVARVPSGASTGTNEALELRDGDPRRYNGRGVLRAIGHVNGCIADALCGLDLDDLPALDQCLLECDGTPDKSRLGANALLAASLAAAHAAAADRGLPLYAVLGGERLLPVPLMNVINGGAHADNGLDLQEFMILPAGAPDFREALRWGTEVFHALKTLLQGRGAATAVGDEGGFAPRLDGAAAALRLLLEAIEVTGLKAGSEVFIGLDVAASEFYHDGRYQLRSEGLDLDAEGFARWLRDLVADAPVVSIEDGMAEDDWEGWALLTEILGERTQLVGDDLFVTNSQILRRGIDEGIANAILIKPNQIGTLQETQAAMDLARENGYAAILSHRSGETEDTTIADLAVATGCGQIKTGAPCRAERTAKYNRLLAIAETLGREACFAGSDKLARGRPAPGKGLGNGPGKGLGDRK